MNPSALTLTKTNSLKDRDRIPNTIGYYAAFIALGMSTASLGPTLPGLAENTGSQLGEISFLFTTGALGYLLGSFFGGRLYDRVSGHRLMAAVLIVMVVMLALVPLLPLLWLLAIVLMVLGMAQGTLDVGGNTLLVWVHRDKVGPFMNGLHFFFGVGSLLAPIIIAQVVLIGGSIAASWNSLAAYWVLALLMLPVIAWLLRLPSPQTQTVSEDEPEGERQVNHLLVALIALFFVIYTGAEVGFGGWVFTYAVKVNLGTETSAAYLNSVFWGALTLGRLLAIPIAARVRPRFILLSDLVGCLASVGVILLWPNAPTMLWLGTFGLGFSMASIFPTMISLAERRMTITGKVTSWFFVGTSIGGMFLPWLIGQLFESVGPRAMMFAVLVDLVAAMFVFVGVMRYSARSVMDKV
ncbi:MAG: MFS transporter [Chloroflexi bacterium]|nr:MFS transporter [Chloroflexota bacterium]